MSRERELANPPKGLREQPNERKNCDAVCKDRMGTRVQLLPAYRTEYKNQETRFGLLRTPRLLRRASLCLAGRACDRRAVCALS